MRNSATRQTARLRLAGWLVALMCMPCVVAAHGLLLDAENHGDTIVGTVYYSNGELAVRESVELLDLSTVNATPVAGTTDDAGKFSFPVIPEHRYRISAYGGEGHGVDVEIEAVADARPELIENESTTHGSFWMPPAWAVIGALLLASMVPVVISRRRQAAQTKE
jgi:hypothetical protein